MIRFDSLLLHKILEELIGGDHAVEPTSFHDFLHYIQGSPLDVVLSGLSVDKDVVEGCPLDVCGANQTL